VIDDRRPRRSPGGHRPRHERVRIVDEQLDPDAGGAGAIRTGLGRVVRVDLMQEERRAGDMQSGHATQVPELARPERILDATAELLATNPGVSLEQVAARAGVSRATLYHHYPGRDALLDALTERSITEVAAAIRSARPEDGPATEAMERVLRAPGR
jgi:Bacterial regulatory proteins, tetR family